VDVVFLREAWNKAAFVMQQALAQIVRAPDVQHVQSVVGQYVDVAVLHRVGPRAMHRGQSRQSPA